MNNFKNLCKDDVFTSAIHPKQKKIVVFGDIHGDYKYAVTLFLNARLIRYKKDRIKWIGKKTYVVQVGDQVDRCRPGPGMSCTDPRTTLNDEGSDIRILNLFNDLDRQALKVGGRVISLLGNHELMNVQGDMRYVSNLGIKQFDDYLDPMDPTKKFKNGTDARKHAFRPGNEYGKLLGCTRVPAVIIGTNLFVHAGIVDGLIDEIKLHGIDDLEKINIEIRKWLLGLDYTSRVSKLIEYSDKSMFWNRLLGKIPPNEPFSNPKCKNNLKQVMKLFRIGSMIIGHTPQSFEYSDDINSTCGRKVWRVDNGSSDAFRLFDFELNTNGVPAHSRRAQHLEIRNNNRYRICDSEGCKKEIKKLI